MTCETFSTEMYVQRMGNDTPLSQEFADHLRSCAPCSQKFAGMIEQDVAIRRTIRSVEPSAALTQSILSGLAVDRATRASTVHRGLWSRWMLVPISVVLAIVTVFVHAKWQARTVIDQAASLLRSSPPLGVEGGDRNQILRWTAQIEPGTDSLPDSLARVQFLGASAVKVDHRAAVLLRMEHEPRASLLIVDAPLLGSRQIASRSADAGSLAYWTEQRKTYVLLFRGNLQELQGYMQAMGITA
jgi:hypothetical protein